MLKGCRTLSDTAAFHTFLPIILSFHSQQLLQHFVHCARICFSLHLLHGLTDEEAEGFFFAALIVGDGLRICGDDLLDDGADYIMTQLCWDMEQFKVWLDKIRSAGVTMPVDVGIMPILDQAATINMALSRNGCVMERELARLISKYWLFPNPFAAKDAEGKPFDMFYEQKVRDFKEAGIEYTIKQIDAYRALGVDGIHLYALNKWQDVSRIIKESGMRTLV